MQEWPFDQAENVVCVSDASVLEGAPILLVIHYSEDDGWAFHSGEPFELSRGKLISMGEALARDPTLRAIAGLPPGYVAERAHVGATWTTEPDADL